MMFFGSLVVSTALRSSSGNASAVDSVCARSDGDTAPAAITEATKLLRLSRELRTSSSAVFEFSLPACTSTRATPESAECGASARVSKLISTDQFCNKQKIIADSNCAVNDAAAECAPTIHATFGSAAANAGACENNRRIGRGERIRTSGLYVPNVALYQAKLHPDSCRPAAGPKRCCVAARPTTSARRIEPTSLAEHPGASRGGASRARSGPCRLRPVPLHAWPRARRWHGRW